MQIADAHHHFWDLANDYPWLTHSPPTGMDVSAFARNYLPDNYLKDASGFGIAKSVHVEAGWNRADPCAETRWLEALAQETGYPHAIIARADLWRENAPAIVAEQAASPLVRGIRMLLTWHPEPKLRRAARNDFIEDATWLRGMAAIADHGLSFDLQIFWQQMASALTVVKRFQSVRFIITHLGLPVDGGVTALTRWRDGLSRLAQFPNVAIKLSGFSHFVTEWSRATVAPFVSFALKTFGADRCLFGSNFPVDRPFISMPTMVEDLAAIIAEHDRTVVSRIFHTNTVHWYQLDR